MKVALVHDFLIEYGGAERVLEALHELWPKAPIYTAFYDKDGPGMDQFRNLDIRTSCLQKLPFSRYLISPLRLFALAFFERFDFSGYDLVISSTWMYLAKGIITKPPTLHLSYIHTPPRFLYGYKTSRNWQKFWWGKISGSILNHLLRPLDFQASQRPDYLIANSQFTADRIWKFYRRRATIIYPPVSISHQSLAISHQPSSYFLCVSRLAGAKRLDLAIKACNQLKKELWICGAGREEEYLKSISGPTIKFLGRVNDAELAKIYQNCRAVIFPAEDEDFGIVPVEAMSFGKPVMALRSGGVTETVIENKTGVFFDEPTVESLIQAIKKLSNLEIKGKNCFVQAQKFSSERFKREIRKFISAKF